MGNNLDLISQLILRSGMKIMVDAGFRKAREAEDYAAKGVKKIVAATETLESFEEVSRMKDALNASVVASIDLKAGEAVAESEAMRLPLEELVARFETSGASEIILLSLDRVGTAQGPDLRSLKNVLKCATVPVIVGGGIRSIADIHALRECGAAGALVATALHKGSIGRFYFDRFLAKQAFR